MQKGEKLISVSEKRGDNKLKIIALAKACHLNQSDRDS